MRQVLTRVMLYFGFVLTCGIVHFIRGQTLDQSKELMNEMLTNYDRRHRPIYNQSSALQVNLTFDIVAIQDFDEVQSMFSVVGVVYMTWYDVQMSWNSSLYGGITSQLYSPADVWYPILVLGNPFDSMADIASNSSLVRVYSNGFTSFAPGKVFKTTCSADVTYFPFDKQKCELRFVPWSYIPSEISLHCPLSYVQQNYYSENGEWSIISSYSYHDDLNTVRFQFTLKRKPLFQVVNVLLPVIFLAFINVLVFMLPAASGERISYVITVLLSIAVFLTLVADNLPKTAEPMSILSYYLMLILVLSTLICFAVIYSMELYHRPEQKMVTWWGKFLVSIFNRCNCNKKGKHTACDGSSKVSPSGENNTNGVMKDGLDKTFGDYQLSQSTSQDDAAITWLEVSYAFDKLCLLIFTVLNVVFVAVFLGSMTRQY